jgi:hypothetical protein
MTSALAETRKSQEADTLAREMAAAFGRVVEVYKHEYKLSAQDAVAKAESAGSPQYEEQVLHGPPDQVSWSALDLVGRADPQLALRRWEEIKQAARDELHSGHRAAKAMEGFGSDCWQRAQFLAIRKDLTEAWHPRNGIEAQLLDAMAQAQTAVFFWLGMLTMRASVECQRENHQVEKEGHWDPPRVSDAEATEQAADMVDRFNKMYLRTLRALRDLRRYVPTVVVQNAGQVNVGGQQVNVAQP